MAKLRFAREKLLVLGLFLTLFSCTKLLVESPGKASGIPGSAADLHYETIGQGRPLLLLHGFGGGSYVWRHLKERLANRHRVILIDLKGFGKSPKLDRGAFYDDEKISREIVENYSAPFKTKGGRRTLVRTARQLIPSNIEAVTALYETLDIPALILWCREDRIVPIRIGRRLHEKMPNSHLTVIEGCGHIPQEEKPEETAARILRFLSVNGNRRTESEQDRPSTGCYRNLR